MPDRFEDIRTFVAVVQGEGFNAAADRLGLVKSAVSRRIRDLEDRLGVRLIDRTTRRISLTELGSEFYERGLRLLADMEDAENLASLGSQEATGRLRLTAPVSLTMHCLAPVLLELMERHPKLSIDVDTSDRMVDIVAEGFDLAVRISRLKDSSLIARRVATVWHVCCASPAYLDRHGRPQRPADLRDHAGVMYANVDPRRYWMFRDKESVEARSRLSFTNGDAVREAAIAGAGIVVLPTFIAHRAIARGELEVVLREHMRPPIGMHAVHPSSRNVSAKVRLFIDFLATRFGDRPYWDLDVFTEAELEAMRAIAPE